jgi:hypothetical protein
MTPLPDAKRIEDGRLIPGVAFGPRFRRFAIEPAAPFRPSGLQSTNAGE